MQFSGSKLLFSEATWPRLWSLFCDSLDHVSSRSWHLQEAQACDIISNMFDNYNKLYNASKVQNPCPIKFIFVPDAVISGGIYFWGGIILLISLLNYALIETCLKCQKHISVLWNYHQLQFLGDGSGKKWVQSNWIYLEVQAHQQVSYFCEFLPENRYQEWLN